MKGRKGGKTMANETNLECFSGGGLVTTAALMTLALADGRTAEEVELLGLFFTTLGDNLALYASRMEPSGGGTQAQGLTEMAGAGL